MSLHSYSRVWLHLTWASWERRPLLTKPAAVKVSGYLAKYAAEKGIYMKINYVNSDHVHALVDLPTGLRIEEMLQLFKGGTSHWLNANNLSKGKFAWGRGYGVFSVSHSAVASVVEYISKQDEHHRKRSFAEELGLLVKRHRLVWKEEETVETVSESELRSGSSAPGLKPGVNEMTVTTADLSPHPLQLPRRPFF